MKKLSILLLVLFSIGLISCEEKESATVEGFTIDVSINNINTSEAYLYNHKNIPIDTSLVSNNYANFSGVIDTIQLYTVQFKNKDLKIPILLENTPMYLYASPLSQIAFGSVSQNELNSYNEALALIKNKLKASIDTQNERVGVGTSAPTQQREVEGAEGVGGIMNLITADTTVSSGSILGTLFFSGADGGAQTTY